MRYWTWMAAKAVAATLLTAGLYLAAGSAGLRVDKFDGVLLGVWILPMVWLGLIVLAWHDQRFRCRTCARRLRMPLTDGSYGTLLLDHPGTEWVCPYGHGKLRVEVWIADEKQPTWREYGDLWEELFRASGREGRG